MFCKGQISTLCTVNNFVTLDLITLPLGLKKILVIYCLRHVIQIIKVAKNCRRHVLRRCMYVCIGVFCFEYDVITYKYFIPIFVYVN